MSLFTDGNHHNVPLFTEPSITKNSRGSPNNNATNFPEVYERPVHKGNKPLLFSSGFAKQDNNLDLNSSSKNHLSLFTDGNHHNVPLFTEPSITINSRGSPNNNATNFPEVYKRPVHKGNKSLLFSSGFANKKTIYIWTIKAKDQLMRKYQNHLFMQWIMILQREMQIKRDTTAKDKTSTSRIFFLNILRIILHTNLSKKQI